MMNTSPILWILYFILRIHRIESSDVSALKSWKELVTDWQEEAIHSLNKNIQGKCMKITPFNLTSLSSNPNKQIIQANSEAEEIEQIGELFESSVSFSKEKDSNPNNHIFSSFFIFPTPTEYTSFLHSAYPLLFPLSHDASTHFLPTYSFANSRLLQMLNTRWNLQIQFNPIISWEYSMNLTATTAMERNMYLPINHYRNKNFLSCIQSLIEYVKLENLYFRSYARPMRQRLQLSQHLDAGLQNIVKQSQLNLIEMEKQYFNYHQFKSEQRLSHVPPPVEERKDSTGAEEVSEQINAVKQAGEKEEKEESERNEKGEKNKEKKFYSSNIQSYYFIIKENVLIYPNGFILTSCGYYLPWDENCEFLSPSSSSTPINSGKYHEIWQRCVNSIQQLSSNLSPEKAWNLLSIPPKQFTSLNQKKQYASLITGCSYQSKMLSSKVIYDQTTAIVITNPWDYNYYHFITDTLSRIVYFLPLFKQYPDLKIIIRRHEIADHTFDSSSPVYMGVGPANDHYSTSYDYVKMMRMKILELFDISSDRILTLNPKINLFVKRVILPRSRSCGEILSHPLPMKRLSKLLLKGADDYLKKEGNRALVFPGRYAFTRYDRNKPNLVVLQRYSTIPRLRNWDHKLFDQLLGAMARHFQKTHNIVYLSSVNITRKDYCYPCMIQEVRNADILIGMHGAGLTNMMFMKPYSLVFEIIDHINDVNLPLCGYYHSLAKVFQHHYYFFGYDRARRENFPLPQFAERVHQVYSFLHQQY